MADQLLMILAGAGAALLLAGAVLAFGWSLREPPRRHGFMVRYDSRDRR